MQVILQLVRRILKVYTCGVQCFWGVLALREYLVWINETSLGVTSLLVCKGWERQYTAENSCKPGRGRVGQRTRGGGILGIEYIERR